ncbi:unnamed protein product [Effrenium voratum]|nr:unnamed protein product [Effrenium voratum]
MADPWPVMRAALTPSCICRVVQHQSSTRSAPVGRGRQKLPGGSCGPAGHPQTLRREGCRPCAKASLRPWQPSSPESHCNHHSCGCSGWAPLGGAPLPRRRFFPAASCASTQAEARCTAPGRDAYLFNLTTAKQCRKLGAEVVSTGDEDNPVYVIDAYVKGNVGRFLNHACGPSFEANVSPIYLFGPEDVVDARLPRVAFFANRSIAPGEELRYDYGMPPEAVLSPSGGVRHQSCLCESRACRGRIY